MSLMETSKLTTEEDAVICMCKTAQQRIQIITTFEQHHKKTKVLSVQKQRR